MFLSAQAVALTPLTFGTLVPGSFSRTSGSSSVTAPFCATGPACGSFAASAEAGAAGGGFVHATLTISDVLENPATQSNYYTAASAGVSYGIMLDGTPGISVPVYISSLVSGVASMNSGSAEGSLTIASPIYGMAYSKDCYDGACYDTGATFDTTAVSNAGSSGPATLVSGKEYIVTLMASVVSQDNGTTDAFVDPIFTVDPAFASQFQLVGIPGAVPEPSTWALMLVGFGCVGHVLRKRPGRAIAHA